MCFPVAGTLMIEPTESESLAELDRFCDAMIAIQGEIDRVGVGRVAGATTTRCATPPTPPRTCWPPTGTGPTAASWPPTRCRALRRDKYWPPVGRIDGGYGDRNLVCACPPPEAFES